MYQVLRGELDCIDYFQVHVSRFRCPASRDSRSAIRDPALFHAKLQIVHQIVFPVSRFPSLVSRLPFPVSHSPLNAWRNSRPYLDLTWQCPGMHGQEIYHELSNVFRLNFPGVLIIWDMVIEVSSNRARHYG